MKINLILATDSYKGGGHAFMLQKGTENTYSYGEARVGAKYKKMVFFGFQPILEILETRVTQEMIDEAKMVFRLHFGADGFFNEDWQIIVDELGGALPLSIKAVAEGTVIEEGNVLFTIEGTDDRFPWLTNYVESILMKVYYPIVVATRSKRIVDFLRIMLEETSDAPAFVADYLLHDFGYRGCPDEEAAKIAGLAHLVNSKGTDTMPALMYGAKHYDADLATLGHSVVASEHSIVTSYKNEGDYLDMMLERFRNGIVSAVGDTRNITDFVNVLVRERKDKIIARWENGTAPVNRLVIRPDSPRWKDDTPEEQVLWIYNTLAGIFGTTINSKGFTVLHPSVGVIYGDGLTETQIFDIYKRLWDAGYSIENCVVGQGGGLVMRDIDRDTQRMAIKGSATKRDGVWIPMVKTPLDHTKASKSGRMKLIKGQNGYETLTETHPLYHDHKDELVEVYRNGNITKRYKFDEIRERASQGKIH